MGIFLRRIKPFLIFAASWAFPGSGHFIQKKYAKGTVFFGGVLILIVMGMVLEGQFGELTEVQPLTVLKFIGSLGTGLLYGIGKALGQGGGDLAARTFDIGSTYLCAAGFMNILVSINAYETAKGGPHA
jgi:hypothetical protein